MTSYTVEVQADFIERQAKAKPVQAVAELIWNGLDADAARVDVRLEHGALGMTKIIVSDNGHGIPFAEAPKLFTRLGGSWKSPGGRTKTKGRMLHGYEGRGRFKAFALGRVADWRVTYRSEQGDLKAYDISMLEDNIREVRITDEEIISAGTPGGEVSVSELHRDFRSLGYTPAPLFRNSPKSWPSTLRTTGRSPFSTRGSASTQLPSSLLRAAWRWRTSMTMGQDIPLSSRSSSGGRSPHARCTCARSRDFRCRRFRRASMSASFISLPT